MISKSLNFTAFAAVILFSSLFCSDSFAQQARITHGINGPVFVQPPFGSQPFSQPQVPQMIQPQVPQMIGPQGISPQVPQVFPQQVPQVFPQQGPQVIPQQGWPQQGVPQVNGGVQTQNGLVYDRMQGGWVTPNQFNGFNQNGAMNTQNSQIMDSAFQHGREQSKNNGTRRWERRPIYGPNGAITGYQEGYVWRNSITGQEHFDMINRSQNQFGGEHKQYHSIQGKPNPNAPRPKT